MTVLVALVAFLLVSLTICVGSCFLYPREDES